jgi:hypothetical protein
MHIQFDASQPRSEEGQIDGIAGRGVMTFWSHNRIQKNVHTHAIDATMPPCAAAAS